MPCTTASYNVTLYASSCIIFIFYVQSYYATLIGLISEYNFIFYVITAIFSIGDKELITFLNLYSLSSVACRFFCYEENLSMDRGKPQQTEMTVEINSILKYFI